MKKELIESKRLDCGIKIDLNEKYRISKNLKKKTIAALQFTLKGNRTGV